MKNARTTAFATTCLVLNSGVVDPYETITFIPSFTTYHLSKLWAKIMVLSLLEKEKCKGHNFHHKFCHILLMWQVVRGGIKVKDLQLHYSQLVI